jgi:hypothetical protein
MNRRQLTLSFALSALAALPWAVHAQSAPKLHSYSFPPSMRMAYDFEGIISSPYTGSAELVWQRDGDAYVTQLFIRKFGLNLQTWTSKGSVTAQGLTPDSFVSKRIGSSEVNAQFLRPQGQIKFSANTPDAVLRAGAQDQLSVFLQLAGLLAAEPRQWSTGKTITFQAVGDRYAEEWTFEASAQESVKLASGTVPSTKFTHAPTAERSQKLELWYGPSAGYLPLRIRITESNGDFLDLLWTGSPKA